MPNPLAPSIKNMNDQPTIINCATGLLETPSSQRLRVRMALERSSATKKKMAPNTIEIGVSA